MTNDKIDDLAQDLFRIVHGKGDAGGKLAWHTQNPMLRQGWWKLAKHVSLIPNVSTQPQATSVDEPKAQESAPHEDSGSSVSGKKKWTVEHSQSGFTSTIVAGFNRYALFCSSRLAEEIVAAHNASVVAAPTDKQVEEKPSSLSRNTGQEDTARLDWLEKNWGKFRPLNKTIPFPSRNGPLRDAIDASLTGQEKKEETESAFGPNPAHTDAATRADR